jgi:uncharacterized protein (DUF2461 family)
MEENMFNGFDKSTNDFFENIRVNNSKEYFNKNKSEYELYVKRPLVELFYYLLDTLMDIDGQFEYKPQRCISTPYTDTRFMAKKPIKEYMYIRYKLSRTRKTDIPGFFFDASNETVRYGIKVYNITATGMEKIRFGLLQNITYYNRYIKRLETKDIKIYVNNKYKKDHYPQIKEPLKNWLNSKDINVYYLLTERNIFYGSELKNSISKTFQEVAKIYILLKSCLDENNMGENKIRDTALLQ